MQVPQPGEIFDGRYRLIEVLGTGGFAIVFRAVDGTQREVALKVLTPRGEQYAPDVQARFHRELKLLGQLRDPHTVRLFDFGQAASGLLYMVFELIPGRDLSEVLAEHGQLPAPFVVHIMRQVLASLREAHDIGVLHRDLKPQNIRLFDYMGDHWNVKLLDFGIARQLGPTDGPSITRAGELIGTPRYMSPEQLTERPLTPSSDLYSLGLVMIELLAGTEALSGHSWGNQLDRLHPGHVFSLNEVARIEAGLASILGKMSALEPAARFQTADEVLEALLQVEEAAARKRASSSSEVRVRPHSASSATLPRLVEEPRDSRWLMYVALGVIALCGAVAGVVIATQTGERAPQPAARRVVALPPAPAPTVRAPKPEPVEPPSLDLGVTAEDEQPPQQTRADGCGQAPPFLSLGKIEFVDGLTSWSWDTYIPPSYDPEREYPLVFLFHDAFQSAGALLTDSRFLDAAEKDEFIVITPIDNNARPWQRPQSVSDIRTMKEETALALCVDLDRVYAVGHGTGGIAAERLSSESWISAVVTTSYRPDTARFLSEPLRPVAHLEINAMDSRRMPRDGGMGCGNVRKVSVEEAETRWAKRNKCTDDTTEVVANEAGTCRRWTRCDQPLVTCRVDGGHGWPGGAGGRVMNDIIKCDPPPGPFDVTPVIANFLVQAGETSQ